MKLQLTNGYILRFDQVSRIMQFSYKNVDRKIIARQSFLESLGISERQFENLSSICVALGLIKKSTFVLTELGKEIAEQDIYFDNIDTLWIIHYIISSESKWIVWNRIINRIFSENRIIGSETALPYFNDLSLLFSEKTIKSKLPKEILSALNAYSEQKFSKLGIIKKSAIGEYVRSEPLQIEPLSFLYCLLHFRDMNFPNATGLVIQEIQRADNSPGKVLFLSEFKTNDLLSKLHDIKLIRLETFGDLDQIRFAEGLTKYKVLHKIYGVTG